MTSISHVKKSASVTIRRFPSTVIFCAVLTLYLFVKNHGWFFSEESLGFALGVYLVSGIGLSFCIDLCSQVYKKRQAIINGIIGHLLIIANAFYAYYVYNNLTTDSKFDLLSVIMLCLTLPFILPFICQKDDMKMWHFIKDVIKNSLLCCIIVFCLYLCLLVLFFLTGILFDIEINIYYDLMSVMFCLVFPIMFLSRMKPSKRIGVEKISTHLSKDVYRLFVWLLGVFLIIHIIYVLQIVISWELPKGRVSLPISCLSILLIVGYCVGYGITKDAQAREGRFLKIMPKIVILPLILMSVGIGRRIMDYGMTAPRFYLVLLNLWFYAMCVYMMFKNQIMPIFVSFVVIGFVSSFGPTSAWRLFDRETTNAVNDDFSKNGSIKETGKKEKEEKVKDGWYCSDYKYYVLTGGNFFKEGTVIDIPQKRTALKSFAVYDYIDASPDKNGIYLIEAVKDYPFTLTREQITNKENDDTLVIQCENGNTIILLQWSRYFNDEDFSTKIRINSLRGLLVE